MASSVAKAIAGFLKLLYDFSFKTQSVSSSSGVLTIDYTQGSYVYCTLTENITSIVVNNWPSSGELGELCIEFTQHASAAKTVAWAAAYKFPGGTDHVMTTTLSAVDLVVIRTRDGGTTKLCDFSQAYA